MAVKGRLTALVSCFLTLWLLTGCVAIEPTPTVPGAAAEEKSGAQQPTPTVITTRGHQAPTPEEKKVSVMPQTEKAVSASRADLAKRLGVAAETIEVVLITKVDWPDTSLGCPQPGYMYAQVITPGYKIILRAQNKEYEYHTDEDGRSVILCPKS